jgi:lipid II:glycine glycyltransferase (peptidoglycan interpeptide bridge formation enzyme)
MDFNLYAENAYQTMLGLRDRIIRAEATIRGMEEMGISTPELEDTKRELEELKEAYNFLCNNLAEQKLAESTEERMEIARKQEKVAERLLGEGSALKNGRRS